MPIAIENLGPTAESLCDETIAVVRDPDSALPDGD